MNHVQSLINGSCFLIIALVSYISFGSGADMVLFILLWVAMIMMFMAIMIIILAFVASNSPKLLDLDVADLLSFCTVLVTFPTAVSVIVGWLYRMVL